jgi:hypothetical protein
VQEKIGLLTGGLSKTILPKPVCACHVSMESNGPRKKRTKRALERKHNRPLPIILTSESTTWSQSLLTTIQWLVGYNVDSTPQITGEYVRSSSSVRISDEKFIQEIFCKGFFGKGNLSRSEPTWAQRSQHENLGLYLSHLMSHSVNSRH